jgi:hypothetical protein
MSKENKFYEISEETINIFMEIASQKCFNEISFQFIGCDTQKTLIKISKLSEQYEFLLNKHILVSLNELLLHKFEPESIQILFEQELDKIHFNIETAKVKLIKTDINTFSTLIKKYGIEKISKANQLAEITAEKMVSNDFENDFIS